MFEKKASYILRKIAMLFHKISRKAPFINSFLSVVGFHLQFYELWFYYKCFSGRFGTTFRSLCYAYIVFRNIYIVKRLYTIASINLHPTWTFTRQPTHSGNINGHVTPFIPSPLHQKLTFFMKDIFSKLESKKTADLVTFAKEILNIKLYFLCTACYQICIFKTYVWSIYGGVFLLEFREKAPSKMLNRVLNTPL